MFEEEIKQFEKENPKFKILCGGDGTLVRDWHLYPKKCIIPIRNYGLCPVHEQFWKDFFAKSEKAKDLKQRICPTLCAFDSIFFKTIDTKSLAEISVINEDPTEALRVNVYVNDHLMFSNIICTGVIFATELGSTGYFKSVSRTIFRSGIGIAFMFPTTAVPSLVLNSSDLIKLEFIRSCRAKISFDKTTYCKTIDKGETFMISQSSDNVSLFGYDIFMHEACRRNRNSSLVNDSYAVI